MQILHGAKYLPMQSTGIHAGMTTFWEATGFVYNDERSGVGMQ